MRANWPAPKRCRVMSRDPNRFRLHAQKRTQNISGELLAALNQARTLYPALFSHAHTSPVGYRVVKRLNSPQFERPILISVTISLEGFSWSVHGTPDDLAACEIDIASQCVSGPRGHLLSIGADMAGAVTICGKTGALSLHQSTLCGFERLLKEIG
jgi:hypothetical protein